MMKRALDGCETLEPMLDENLQEPLVLNNNVTIKMVLQ